MKKNNRITVSIHLAFLVIATLLVSGMEFVNAPCEMGCVSKSNNQSLAKVIPSYPHITRDCCCSLKKSLCTAGSASTAYFFNVTTSKSLIGKSDARQLNYALYEDNAKEILKHQIYRNRQKHFFIKEHPLYLQHRILIC